MIDSKHGTGCICNAKILTRRSLRKHVCRDEESVGCLTGWRHIILGVDVRGSRGTIRRRRLLSHVPGCRLSSSHESLPVLRSSSGLESHPEGSSSGPPSVGLCFHGSLEAFSKHGYGMRNSHQNRPRESKRRQLEESAGIILPLTLM